MSRTATRRIAACFLLLPAVPALTGCGRSYSPDTYANTAVQQANKAEQGTITGVRRVRVAADGTAGAVTGGAAGGIVGSQAPGGTLSTALGAVGGTLVGGLVGSAAEKATGQTDAFEYIIRKENGELLSVTQRDTVPLFIGQKVLVIQGSQARVLPDYTVPSDADQPIPRPSAQQVAPSPPPVSATPLPAPPPAPTTPAPALPLL